MYDIVANYILISELIYLPFTCSMIYLEKIVLFR